MSFAIVTDTSANLPSPLLAEKDVTVVPFSYFYNEQEHTCLDTEAFDGAKYYGAMRTGLKIRTSQINPQRYVDTIRPLLEDGWDVLFIGMSSGISGSYQSARIAAQQLREDFPGRRIYTIDTLGASLGEGIPVLKAVEYREQGLSLDETTQRIMAMRHRMYQVFVVDDLMHLRSTGRISGAVAIVGTVLQIKPLLKGNEQGQIVNFAKVRGRRHAIEALAQKYDALVEHPEDQIVGIAHADNAEDAEYLASLLRKNRPPKEIMTVVYEPVTGSHVGPGTVALFFEGNSEVRGK